MVNKVFGDDLAHNCLVICHNRARFPSVTDEEAGILSRYAAAVHTRTTPRGQHITSASGARNAMPDADLEARAQVIELRERAAEQTRGRNYHQSNGGTTMRKQFIQATSRHAAKKAAPWAAVIAQCDGGFMAFESPDDYRTWRLQK